jgi:adenylate kinase family enzyme
MTPTTKRSRHSIHSIRRHHIKTKLNTKTKTKIKTNHKSGKYRLKSTAKPAKNVIWFDEKHLSGCDEPPNAEELDDIGEAFFDNKTPVKNPNAIFTFGYPGSGKTTAITNILGKNHNYVVASVDDIVQRMKGFQDGISFKANNKNVMLGSTDIFYRCSTKSNCILTQIIHAALEDGNNVLFDIPKITEDDLKLCRKFKHTITGLLVVRTWKNTLDAIESRAYETGRWLKNWVTGEKFKEYMHDQSKHVANLAVDYFNDFIICINDAKIKVPEYIEKYLQPLNIKTKKTLLHGSKGMRYFTVDISKMSKSKLTQILSALLTQ